MASISRSECSTWPGTTCTRQGWPTAWKLTCGDAVQLSYPPDTLDAVFLSFTPELVDTPEIPKVLAECKRVLRRGGRIVVVGVSREGEGGIILRAFEWSHRHLPNLVDCGPIFVRQSLESAGFRIESAEKKMMWVPVEVVLGVKFGGGTSRQGGGSTCSGP
jgi:ubiquinone/menaquinone biosynthesis C-methylase UbiE